MYFCECLSVHDYFAAENTDNLYQFVKSISLAVLHIRMLE